MNALEAQWNNALRQINGIKNKNTVAARVKMRSLIKADQKRVHNFEKANPYLKNNLRKMLQMHKNDVKMLNYSLKFKNMSSVHQIVDAYLPSVLSLNKVCKLRSLGRFAGLFMKNEARIAQDLVDVISHSVCNGDPVYIQRFIDKMKCKCASDSCYIGKNGSCSISKENRSQKIHAYYKVFVQMLNTHLHSAVFGKQRFTSNQARNYKNIYMSEEARLSFADGILHLIKIKGAAQQTNLIHAILLILSKFALYKDVSFVRFVQLVKPEINQVTKTHPLALKALLKIAMGSAGFQYREAAFYALQGYLVQPLF